LCTITHFFCKYVGWVAFSTDVGDGDAAIRDPFASGVLVMFDVAVSSCGQIMAPFYTGFVVVV
jgi:hypothetical protein